MNRIFAALICFLAVTPAPAQSLFETDSKFRAREMQVLRDGEAKFSQNLSEFNQLLSENPQHGTPARTRLSQLAFQLNDSAKELKSRYDFAWRYPQARDELSTFKRPWERFLSAQTPQVRDLIREGSELARSAPGTPVRGPTPTGQQPDIDLAALSRDIGVPLGPPVSRSSPDALPVPPGSANRSAPPSVATAPVTPSAPSPPSPPPAVASPPSSGNVYFAVLSAAYRTSDPEWNVPECRFREIAKTRTNYASRTEAEGDAARMRSLGYADAETRYFDTYQRMDEFMRDWAQRRASDSRRCTEAYAQLKQRGR